MYLLFIANEDLVVCENCGKEFPDSTNELKRILPRAKRNGKYKEVTNSNNDA